MRTLIVVLLSLILQALSNAADHSVTITGFTFQPQTLNIQVGDTVTWTQLDSAPHTATANDNSWDSGNLNQGQTYSRTFTSAGSAPYYCIYHPSMTATINVASPVASLTIVIDSPTNNTMFAAATNVTIAATATGDASTTVTNVEFLVNGSLVGNDATLPYSFTTPMTAGTHTLLTRALAANGLRATSAPVMISINSNSTRIDNPLAKRIEKGDLTIELETVAEGFASPLGLVAPADGSGRLFVYDQIGFVQIVSSNGVKSATPLLDVRSRLVPLRNYDERGLLGFALHPGFATNGLVYTYTSEPNGPAADFPIVIANGGTNNHQSVVAEWRVTGDQVDIASRREIVRLDKPQANHNGGTLRFGPDNFLYISLGDGGQADDEGLGHSPGGNGQDLQNLLGKMVRIDVNGRTSANGQYAVPTDNPFVGIPGLDEIWAYGLRNPFSYSFDRLTGELYVADVGQNKIEELDLIFRGGNYGWPIKEGTFYFDPASTNAGFVSTVPVTSVPANLIDPIAQYDRDDGTAIMAANIYRGTRLPSLIGRFVGGDWGTFAAPSGRLYYVDRSEFKEFRIGVTDRPLGLWLKGMGEDAAGEIYVFGSTTIGPGGTSGKMLKMVPVNFPTAMTSVSTDKTNLNVAWAQGVGPFQVQRKTSLSEDVWCGFTSVTQRNASLAMQTPNAFYRVADAAGNPGIPFTASLSGPAEKPTAAASSATGSAILRLEGNTLSFDIEYRGLGSTAIAAHLHGSAAASEFAGVMVDLAPFHTGPFGTKGSFSGAVTLTPAQKVAVMQGRTYLNVHSSTFQGGEIRGQVVPVHFSSALVSTSERPAVDSKAKGLAQFFLVHSNLTIQASYSGLKSNAIAAHLHGPTGVTNSTGVLIDLQPLNGGQFSTNGLFTGTVSLSPEQIGFLVDGLIYINIHTPAHQAGEIRGQVWPQALDLPLTASLSGESERPASGSTATGLATFSIRGDSLQFNVTYQGLTTPAIAAHIHGPGFTSNSVGVLINLAPFSNGAMANKGVFSGSVALTPEQRSLLFDGRTYVNIHTDTHSGGEIRGQIVPTLLHSVLLGASERPNAVHTFASGSSHLTLVGKELTLNATYRGLPSPAIAAHIHAPAGSAGSAGVAVDLAGFNGGSFGTNGIFAGRIILATDRLNQLSDGRSYLNIHTTNNPGGEIRGQIRR